MTARLRRSTAPGETWPRSSKTEWGSDGYAIMCRLKELVDPANLLNPGVIINPDRQAHLANLKQLPSVEPEIDKCIECGYCEPKCPSRELTLTPRQRIVVRREMARLQEGGDRSSSLMPRSTQNFPTWRSTPALPMGFAPPLVR